MQVCIEVYSRNKNNILKRIFTARQKIARIKIKIYVNDFRRTPRAVLAFTTVLQSQYTICTVKQ